MRDNSTERNSGTVGRTKVQLELDLPVLCRLIQERSLSACEFRCLDVESHRAGCWAVKFCCTACASARPQEVPPESR